LGAYWLLPSALRLTTDCHFDKNRPTVILPQLSFQKVNTIIYFVPQYFGTSVPLVSQIEQAGPVSRLEGPRGLTPNSRQRCRNTWLRGFARIALETTCFALFCRSGVPTFRRLALGIGRPLPARRLKGQMKKRSKRGSRRTNVEVGAARGVRAQRVISLQS
jgi:hypothetical protein